MSAFGCRKARRDEAQRVRPPILTEGKSYSSRGRAPTLTLPRKRKREGWGSSVGQLVLVLTCAPLAARGSAPGGPCGGPGPFVREGNADSVEIGFSGDLSNAMPLARKHCAQFE